MSLVLWNGALGRLSLHLGLVLDALTFALDEWCWLDLLWSLAEDEGDGSHEESHHLWSGGPIFACFRHVKGGKGTPAYRLLDFRDEFAKLTADLEALDYCTGNINAETGGDDAEETKRDVGDDVKVDLVVHVRG